MAGWGKTASDESQLKYFIEQEAQCKARDPGYRPLYKEDTELFPKTPRMAFNFIQDDSVCFGQYGTRFG